MMKNKKLKKGFAWKSLILLIISTLISYSTFVLYYMYFQNGKLKEVKPEITNYKNYFFEFKNVWNSITSIEIYAPYIIIIAIFLAICWLVQGILLDEKGYSEADQIGIHGTSKWGNPKEMRNGKILAKHKESKFSKNLQNNLNMKNGFILGKTPDKNELLIMHDDTSIDNQNVAIIGSSGAGKTQAYVLPNIINIRNKSIIVTDPKGELFELTSELKRDQGFKVYQVDFVKFMQSKYNPLYYVETPLDAQKIANTIISNFEKGGEGSSGAFFKNSATNILSALIVYVKTEYDKDEANLEKVVEIYDKHIQNEEVFLKWVDTVPADHPAKPLLNSIKDLTDVTRKSVTSTLNNGFSLFKLPEVKAMTSKSDFNFEDFIEEKSILYVKLSMEDNTFAPLTSVFFSQMINIYYQIAQNSPTNKLKRKVVFMLDEFANIGKLDNYSRVLATCRSLGLSMHTIIQNKAQLEDKNMYGKDEATAILSNHDTTILLRAKDTDTTTTKWISEALGDTTISQKKNDMTKSKGNISEQLGDNYHKRPLMTPAEIGSLKKHECIVMISGHHPLFLHKAFQYEVYPDLLTKKTKKGHIYNYSNIRKKLGYANTIIEEENKYDITQQKTFSQMREEARFKEQDKQAEQQIKNNGDSNEDSNSSGNSDLNRAYNEVVEESEKIDLIKSHIDELNESEKGDLYDELNAIKNIEEIEDTNVYRESYESLDKEEQKEVVDKTIDNTFSIDESINKLDNKQKDPFGY
ncbi:MULTISPECIES: VirD4-like conjugal transfer protein, CD1115 family [Macrococcoides]|uniref:VirD4-like conjugal transfer protein, CD1115 family n=1 Tax=Macrococcoides TaxID=3076173 RepID=UPI000C34586E|nr:MULTISPECIES: type IV secretory system conjugative DNA transfer family protein [Macrococcus]PKE18518.1 hypothetical protein CW679_10525 [Macrococcus caseolyticus]QNR09069.1 type IV secretion system DNA-binding domain-containing protein [Macrococcus canis]